MHYIELIEGTRETAWSVSEWFLREYVPNYNISLTIEERDLSEEGVEGWCIKESDTHFLIQLHNNLQYDFIQVLLHELTHMKQWVEGRKQDEYEAYCQEMELLDKYMNKD